MIGRKLRHYTISEELGVGGMGEVYRAHDSKLNRDVALKLLPEELANNPEHLARFQREAKVLASLDHPNIVTIYSVEEDDGVHFLTMALVKGRTLAELIPLQGVKLERIFKIVEPLADALAVAHDSDITHRDLKPGNIMVTDDGRVMVLDFGLAKMMTASVGDSTELNTRTLTQHGSVVGTVPYMSPEQVEGKPVDHRSDIFSLGIVLYEMAAGKRPFDGASAAALTSSILRDTPERLDASRPDLPRHLQRIIFQCLEKDPAARPQTSRDVYNQFRNLRKEVESGALSDQITQVAAAAQPARSERRWLPLALAAGLGLLAFGWWFSSSREGAETRSSSTAALTAVDERKLIAVLPFENLGPEDQAYFAAGVTDEITSRLAGVEGLGVLSRSAVKQYDRSGKSIRQVGEEMGVGYILDGSIRWAQSPDGSSRVRITPQLVRTTDETTVWGDSYDRVLEDIFTVQAEIAQSVFDSLDVTLLDSAAATAKERGTSNLAAYDAFLRGSEYFNTAVALYSERDLEHAIRFFEEATSLDPEYALAHARLAWSQAYMWHWGFDRSEERHALTRQAADRALELAPQIPEAHVALSYYYRDRLEFDEVVRELELAREARPGDSEIISAIAEQHWWRGDTDKAIENYRHAAALDPRRAETYCNTGGVYRMRGEHDKAEEAHRHAIELRPDRTCMYFCTVYIWLNWKGPERALEYLESIPDSVQFDEVPPINYAWTQIDMMQGKYENVLARLDQGSSEAYQFQMFYYPKSLLAAWAHHMLGDEEAARAEYGKARDYMEALIAENPLDSRLYGALGLAHAGLGNKEEALAAGQRSVELLPFEQDVFRGPYRLKDMALIYAMVGQTERALDTLEVLFSAKSQIHPSEVKLDPIWGDLRDQPRFRGLSRDYRTVSHP